MSRRRHTPWLLIALGLGFAVITGWSFYRAAGGVSTVTDPDYYSHGLRYNQTLLERQAAQSLGWQLRVVVRDRLLEAELTAGDNKPVSGARGAAGLHRPDGPPLRLPLAEGAPGRYQLPLPADLDGELTVDLAFARDGAHLQRRLLVSLPRR